MEDKYAIAKNWLPRYTGMQPDEFGDYILLTNFKDYLTSFCEKFDIEPMGQDKLILTDWFNVKFLAK